jgi:hypothetical protein
MGVLTSGKLDHIRDSNVESSCSDEEFGRNILKAIVFWAACLRSQNQGAVTASSISLSFVPRTAVMEGLSDSGTSISIALSVAQEQGSEVLCDFIPHSGTSTTAAFILTEEGERWKARRYVTKLESLYRNYDRSQENGCRGTHGEI